MTRESQVMDKYKRLGCENIGTQSGTTKFIYIDTETGQRVAFHSLILRPGPTDGDSNNKEFGVPLMTIREVSIQKVMDHENVARLVNIDYDSGDGFVRLIFEYPGMNLTKFMKEHPVKADDPKLIKKLLHQLLSGIAYYHSVEVAHGNLNAQNVLIDPENDKLKITNFPLDLNVECHKAPELLMGSNVLSRSADMFSCGCLFGEMMKKAPLFRGSSDAARRLSIFNLLGTPSEENWPDAILQYGDSEREKIEPKELKEVFPGLEEDGLDLLSKLLCLDPMKRITAADSLKHPYFKEVKD